MPDYRKEYFALFRAMEKAISILIDAQQKAEKSIISQADPIIVLPPIPLEPSE